MTEVTQELEVVNSQEPIWTRDPGSVSKEEYTDFYKGLSSDWEAPAFVKHSKAEGQLVFTSLLFLSKRAPFDMFSGGEDKKHNNVRLHARRVFIQDNCKELMPEYLSFVQGVVDSDDLPLNISREVLQGNQVIRVMRKHLVKKTLEAIAALSEDEEAYKSFYLAFSKNLKLGIHEDKSNQAKLASLLRYATTRTGEGMTSLESYVSRMKEGQEAIYYITGDSHESVATSPFIEQLVQHDYEVLLMTDAIDEYAMQQLKEFGGKKFVCVTEEGMVLPGGPSQEVRDAYEPLCKLAKEVLGDQVEKVVVSGRIATSPCCLVTSQYGYSANMERILKAQALRDSQSMMMVASKKIMEINPNDPIIQGLLKSATPSKDAIWMLYEVALLTSGFALQKPTLFAARIHKLLALGLGYAPEQADVDEPEEVPTPTMDKSETKAEEDSTMEEVD